MVDGRALDLLPTSGTRQRWAWVKVDRASRERDVPREALKTINGRPAANCSGGRLLGHEGELPV
jgi:hypothetical protein